MKARLASPPRSPSPRDRREGEDRLKRFFCYWLPFLLYSSLIVYLSHQPHIELIIDPGDKFLHFMEYYAYAFFLRRLLVSYDIKKYFILTLVISVLWGISDELHQYFIPGRDCNVVDMLLDLIGAYAWLITVKYLPNKGIFSLAHK